MSAVNISMLLSVPRALAHTSLHHTMVNILLLNLNSTVLQELQACIKEGTLPSQRKATHSLDEFEANTQDDHALLIVFGSI